MRASRAVLLYRRTFGQPGRPHDNPPQTRRRAVFGKRLCRGRRIDRSRRFDRTHQNYNSHSIARHTAETRRRKPRARCQDSGSNHPDRFFVISQSPAPRAQIAPENTLRRSGCLPSVTETRESVHFVQGVSPLVPSFDHSGPRLPGGNLALEVAEGQRVVVRGDGQALQGKVPRADPPLTTANRGRKIFRNSRMPIYKNSILFINTLCSRVIRKQLANKYLAEYMATRGVGCSLRPFLGSW